jgi:hypothetical protein
VALANKTARIIWKLMVSGEHYNRDRNFGQGEAPAVDREGRRAALREGSAQRPSLRLRTTPPQAVAIFEG